MPQETVSDAFYNPPEKPDTYATETFKNVPIQQNPFDIGRLNESPIRGRGQIKVNHNMPAPDDTDHKLTEALWLLQDNSYTCYKPNTKLSRR